MARAFGRILSSIWDDDDFLDLEPTAQRLYQFLVSQPNLNHAGLLPLTLRRWAKKAKGLTAAALEQDLKALDGARFIVVDEDSEELLIRTFIRNDGVYKQPRVMGSMVSGAMEISSRRLRQALLAEMDRIPLDELSDEPTKLRGSEQGPSIRVQVAEHIATLRRAFAVLDPQSGRSDVVTPSAPPSRTPSIPPSATPSDAPEEALADEHPEGAAEGDMEGVPEPPPQGVPEEVRQGGDQGDAEGLRGYARTRGPAAARTSPAPAPAPAPAPPPNPPSVPRADETPSPPATGQSGREGGGTEAFDDQARTLLAALEPARLRPGRGIADRIAHDVAVLLALGWPVASLAERMTADPPAEIHNLGGYLTQRLPPPVTYQPPPPARTLTTGRRVCATHQLELPDSGTCRGCAADARARTDDDFDLDARPPAPPPRREPRARQPDAAADPCNTCTCCTGTACWPGPDCTCPPECPCSRTTTTTTTGP
jgi:hypothetical protein